MLKAWWPVVLFDAYKSGEMYVLERLQEVGDQDTCDLDVSDQDVYDQGLCDPSPGHINLSGHKCPFTV